MANWSDDGEYRSHKIPRGSFVKSLDEIAKDNKLTLQNTRTALKNLKNTGELTFIKVYRGLMITVVKYDEYQSANTYLTFNSHLSNTYNGFLPIKEKEEKKGKNVCPPSLDEVRQFALEINSKTNPEKFYYHCEANGWPKNWQAKFMEWTAQDGKYEPKGEEKRKWES